MLWTLTSITWRVAYPGMAVVLAEGQRRYIPGAFIGSLPGKGVNEAIIRGEPLSLSFSRALFSPIRWSDIHGEKLHQILSLLAFLVTKVKLLEVLISIGITNVPDMYLSNCIRLWKTQMIFHKVLMNWHFNWRQMDLFARFSCGMFVRTCNQLLGKCNGQNFHSVLSHGASRNSRC